MSNQIEKKEDVKVQKCELRISDLISYLSDIAQKKGCDAKVIIHNNQFYFQK